MLLGSDADQSLHKENIINPQLNLAWCSHQTNLITIYDLQAQKVSNSFYGAQLAEEGGHFSTIHEITLLYSSIRHLPLKSSRFRSSFFISSFTGKSSKVWNIRYLYKQNRLCSRRNSRRYIWLISIFPFSIQQMWVSVEILQ